MNPRHDAIIIGGGPAGATAAILLAQAGWRVAVIEKAAFPRRKVCGEYISATTWPLLRTLGVADGLLERAGPAVRRVGVFAGTTQASAALATPPGPWSDGGRALGREHLDTVLLARAAAAGAEIRQPWTLRACATTGDGYACTLADARTGRTDTLHARLVVAAHGSWESGPLPTQDFDRPPRAHDLFGFKAHFHRGALPPELMPLLAFPGGYGGMVHTDGGRLSLSCCIRRDRLAQCRRQWPHLRAGAAVLAHIAATCTGAAQALSGATPDGAWLAAGPLRTGLRGFGGGRLFTVGNATAEAHPIVAEGISMAIQSATLLCEGLLASPDLRAGAALSLPVAAAIRAAYARDWRGNFSRRLHTAALFAHLFMRPAPARIAAALLERWPRLLTEGARWSGKAEPLRGARAFDAIPP